MYQTGKKADAIVREKGLLQVTDTSEIEKAVDGVLAANSKEVDAYRKGKEKVFGFFVGQVMKATQGKANPAQVNERLKERLDQA